MAEGPGEAVPTAIGSPEAFGRLVRFIDLAEEEKVMRNEIARCVHRMLAERVDGVVRAELIARAIVRQALDGDPLMCRLVMELEATFDPTTAAAWGGEEDDG
jgi:hypothetical protein